MPSTKHPNLSLKTLTRSWLRARGPDALRFLNGMWTCDFKRAGAQLDQLTTGAGFLLSVKGKAITYGVFVRESVDSFLFSLPAGFEQKAFEALDHYLVADEVELAVLSDAPFEQVYALPNSPFEKAGRARLLEPSTPEAKDEAFTVAQESWGLRVPRGLLSATHEELWVKKGAALPYEISEMSESEYNTLRIGAGVFEWGVDLAPDTLPLEFPVAPFISFHKGCYIGQEIIARATYRGHMTRAFARFRAQEPLRADFIYAESDPERPVGKLSTAEGTAGLGLVRLAVADQHLFQVTPNGKRTPILSVEPLIEEKATTPKVAEPST